MENTQEMKQKIHKDMTIAEILQLDPHKTQVLADIMTEAGLHCVGCGAATFETLEQGVLGHGNSEEKVTELVEKLNAAFGAASEEKTEEVSPENFKLTFTSSAITKAKEVMKSDGKEGCGLRVSVLPGGCSGFNYDLQFKEKAEENDLIFEEDGLSIFVDSASLSYLQGCEIDYVDTLNESGFVFKNPQASNTCGCGKSFS